MNRYERQDAAHRIDGYYNPEKKPESNLAEFERAKSECLQHMHAAVAQTEAMTFSEFLSSRPGAYRGMTALSREEIIDLLPVMQIGWKATDYGEWVARAVERAHGIMAPNAQVTGRPPAESSESDAIGASDEQ